MLEIVISFACISDFRSRFFSLVILLNLSCSGTLSYLINITYYIKSI